jgi:hypothetical protein
MGPGGVSLKQGYACILTNQFPVINRTTFTYIGKSTYMYLCVNVANGVAVLHSTGTLPYRTVPYRTVKCRHFLFFFLCRTLPYGTERSNFFLIYRYRYGTVRYRMQYGPYLCTGGSLYIDNVSQ